MSRALTCALALAAATLVAGCSDFFYHDTKDETASESSSSGDAADMCGEAPEGPACAPPSSSNLGALCGARATESECLAFGDGVTSKCAWAQVTAFTAEGSACGGSARGVCVGLQASAGACNASSCGGGVNATTYYRYTSECTLEVFQGQYCGFEVVDWSACEWSESPTATCSKPWPSAGPAACRCAC